MLLIVANINTPVTPRLQPYCDQFLNQMAADRSKVAVRSQCGRGRSHWYCMLL